MTKLDSVKLGRRQNVLINTSQEYADEHLPVNIASKVDAITIIKEGQIKSLGRLSSKLTSVDTLLKSKMSRLNETNTKLKQFEDASFGVPELPQINTKALFPDLTTFSREVKAVLPSPKISNIKASDLVNGTNVNIPTFSELKSIKISSDLKYLKIPALDARLSKDFGSVSATRSQIEKYTSGIKQLASGDNLQQAQKEIEEKIGATGEVKKIQAQTIDIEKYKELEKKWSEDPDAQKEMALKKAKEASVDYFAGHDQQLQAALSKATQLKQKFNGAEGTLDIMKRRQVNAMKGKSFKERFLPGITLQFQNPAMLWVDFNPYVSYRLTGRFTLVAGWNERLVYDTKNSSFFSNKRIYGIRSSVHFRIKENLWLKGDVESMNSLNAHAALANRDLNSRVWIWTYFGGIRKDFRFSKKVVGTTQVLYNLYDPKHESPYSNKLNLRIGFEYKLQ